MNDRPEAAPQTDPFLHPAFAPALLFLVALLAFGNGLLNEHSYDAALLIARWTAADGGMHPLGTIFLPGQYSEYTAVMSYRPVGVLMGYLLDVALFRGNPSLSNLVNLLLHVANAWLLSQVLMRLMPRLSGTPCPALCAALFFLLHPLVTEVVFCAGFRFDLLAMFFVLIGCWLATGPLGSSRIAVPVSAISVLLGLLSKEIAVVALPLLPLMVRAAGGTWLRAGAHALALVLAFALFLPIWRLFQFSDYPAEFLGGGGRLLGLANFLVSLQEVYLARLLLPWPLRVDYAFEPVATFSDPRLYIALSLIGLTAVAIGWLARASALAAIGAAWVVVAFLPISQVVPVPDPVAERFAYFPLAGVAMIMAGAVQRLLETGRVRHDRLVLPFVALMVVYTGLDIWRSLHWRNDLALNIANWELPADDRPIALESLGALYLTRATMAQSKGNDAGAANDFRASRANLDLLLSREPDNVDGLRLSAVWHAANGNIEGANRDLSRALLLEPENAELLALRQRLAPP